MYENLDCGNPKPKPAQRLENAGEMQDVPFSRGIMKETAIGNMLQEGGNGIKERDMTMGHQLVSAAKGGGREGEMKMRGKRPKHFTQHRDRKILP